MHGKHEQKRRQRARGGKRAVARQGHRVAVALLAAVCAIAVLILANAGATSHVSDPQPMTRPQPTPPATTSPRPTPTPPQTPEPTPSCRFSLTPEERDLTERVVMAEAGGESYEGQMAVAQCILNACEKLGSQPSEALLAYQYAKPAEVATQSVKDAVAAVFDDGETVTTEPIMFFYAPRWTDSEWHETQRFIMEIGGHRFFAEKGANQ